MTRRVDTHQHLIPDFYRRELEAAGLREAGGRELPHWSPDAAIELMDLLGTQTAIVAVSTPGVSFLGKQDRAADLARELNDFAAALPSERFGFFATLPMPDVRASVNEAERALDELRADGIVLAPSPGGIYLGATEHGPAVQDARRTPSRCFHPPRRAAGPDGREHHSVCRRLSPRHDARGLSARTQRHRPPLSQDPLHPQPRWRFRPLCLPPPGDHSHG